MPDVFIVAAARTPIGRFGGMLKEVSPVALGAHVMRAVLSRAALPATVLDLYIMGHVLRAGHGQLVPRQAALRAGIPATVDGYAVDMVCSSGMMSLLNGAAVIRAGQAQVVLAGGMESMSQAGFFLSHRARWGYKFLHAAPENLADLLLQDGLTDPLTGEAMGSQAERLAAEHGITRPELDEMACLSHHRAAQAAGQGLFAAEITPLETAAGPLDRDEGIRPNTTSAALAALPPAFAPDGLLTAGNASQISDGAAALLLADDEAVARYGLTPLARLLDGAWAAGETWRFPEAPIPAVKKLLHRLNLTVTDFDLFENNEAFALNNLLFTRTLDVPLDKLNVLGGAIALGHPIGASGARIVVTLLNALRQRGQSRGLAAICHGLGGSTALALELV
jgi:acetyl-CoA C-acetyltransferase